MVFVSAAHLANMRGGGEFNIKSLFIIGKKIARECSLEIHFGFSFGVRHVFGLESGLMSATTLGSLCDTPMGNAMK